MGVPLLLVLVGVSTLFSSGFVRAGFGVAQQPAVLVYRSAQDRERR
jgi:hypothetical protein